MATRSRSYNFTTIGTVYRYRIDLAAGFSCNVLNITPHHMIDSSTYLVLHKVHPRLAMPIADS